MLSPETIFTFTSHSPIAALALFGKTETLQRYLDDRINEREIELLHYKRALRAPYRNLEAKHCGNAIPRWRLSHSKIKLNCPAKDIRDELRFNGL